MRAFTVTFFISIILFVPVFWDQKGETASSHKSLFWYRTQIHFFGSEQVEREVEGSRWRTQTRATWVFATPKRRASGPWLCLLEASTLGDVSSLSTLSIWYHPVNTLAELPFYGQSLAAGKELLQEAFNKLGRKVSLTSHQGAFALERKTVTARALATALQKAGEHLFGQVQVILNQKEPVWGKGVVLDSTTLQLLPPWLLLQTMWFTMYLHDFGTKATLHSCRFD